MSQFHKLQVLEVRRETADAVVVSFDVPHNLYDTFNYQAGQYLTLRFQLGREEVRRSYSLCSCPHLEEPLQIGVKRVEGGLVSNHINEELKAGDWVEVMPPDGKFFAEVQAENYKTYYLFAAGSGITPILSILRTVLNTETRSYVHMLYGNRAQDSIMFKEELDALQEEYADRLILVHSLSRPNSSWSDLWTSAADKPYRTGRIDAEAVNWFINTYPPYAQNVEYFICGPGTMIDNTRQALKAIDVPDQRIFVESFGGGPIDTSTTGVANAQLTAHLNGETVETKIPEGTTVLRALIQAGKEPPYSCEGGVCSSCRCKLVEGKVHMRNNLALDDDEVKQGHILSCQSIPLTEIVKVRY